GILGVAGREPGPASVADALVLGRLAKVLDDRQVSVTAPLRTGPIRPLTAPGRHGRGLILVVTIEVIRAILGQILLTPPTEELVLELAILAAELFDLRFESPLPF